MSGLEDASLAEATEERSSILSPTLDAQTQTGVEQTDVSSESQARRPGFFSRYIWHLRGWRSIYPISIVLSYIGLGILTAYTSPEQPLPGPKLPPRVHVVLGGITGLNGALALFILVCGFLSYAAQDALTAWLRRIRPWVPWKFLALLCAFLFTAEVRADKVLATTLGNVIIRLLLALLYSTGNRIFQPIDTIFEDWEYPKLIYLALVPSFLCLDQAMGMLVFSQPILAFLSAWTTILTFQNMQAGSRGASWYSIGHFVISVCFCELSVASPKKMGIPFGAWAILYYTFVLVSTVGFLFEFMKDMKPPELDGERGRLRIISRNVEYFLLQGW